MTHKTRRVPLAALLVPIGVAIAIGGMLGYGLDWLRILAPHPEATALLKRTVRVALEAATYIAVAVPVAILVGSAWRFAVASGARGLAFLKLTAYIILWAAGSFVLFFALFAAYFMGDAHAQVQLLVPALLAATGYALIGTGLAISAFR
jgi:hypothetical protein